MPQIGRSEYGPVQIDVERLVESRMLIQANSGAGKSFALRRVLEVSHGKVQQIVLDVEDEFYTLREKYDYILAGRHGGDCPADCRSAALLARKLLELNISAIVGIYELKMHERIRFVRLFLEALVNAPRELWHPALIVIDEAHLFAPQAGSAESCSAVIDLMARGRKRGFCGILATQRISKIHKDAVAEANNKLIGRAALDIDMKRAADELGFSGKEEQRSLRTLAPGYFYTFGPALTDVVTLVKIGMVETTHPKPGQRNAAAPAPREKVKMVLAQLADLPKEADAELKTLAEHKAEIRRLEHVIRNKPAVAASAPDERTIQTAINRALAEIKKQANEGLKKQRTQIRALGDRLEKISVLAKGTIDTVEWTPPWTTIVHLPAVSSEKTFNGIPIEQRLVKPISIDGLGNGGDRRMLAALAQHGQPMTATKLSILTGIARNGGTFRTYIGKLKSNGWVSGPSTQLEITPTGIEAIGDFSPLPTGQGLIDFWRRELGESGMRKLFDCLVASYPSAKSKDEICGEIGMEASGGTYRTYMGKLKSLGLVEGRGELVASKHLFEA